MSLNGTRVQYPYGAIAQCWNGVACFAGIPRYGGRKGDWVSQIWRRGARGERALSRAIGYGGVLSRSGLKGFARIFLVGP